MKRIFSILIAFSFLSLTSAYSVRTDASQPSAETSPKSKITILFLGDSLTAGYGVLQEEAFPALVEKKLRAKGHAVRVINAGMSGSVTAGADARLRFYLKTRPDIVVLVLGANDGFKGTPAEVIRKNLAQAIDLAKANDIKVLLGGMKINPNLGAEYVKSFEGLYPSLAKEKNVPLIPFIVEGVAAKTDLNLQDGKHPNPRGHEIIASLVEKHLEPLL